MRWGITVPFAGVPLPGHRSIYAELAEHGYTDLWSAEVAGADAFTPLTLASTWQEDLRLGTAIAPTFTRGPGLLAMTSAALAEAAPGRFVLGIGASSPVIVGDWNATEFVDPYGRTRDVLRFLRTAWTGEVVDHAYPSFTVRRFRLERPPPVPPRLFLAALRPGMLRLAAAEADGVILNWLAASDVARSRAELTSAGEGFDVVARIFVCPTDDAAYARALGRRLIAAYLTVPVYAEFHRWLGRDDVLGDMWRQWAAGDRKGAAESVPDEVVDALIPHGDPATCVAKIRQYVAAGVTTPVIALMPTPDQPAGLSAILRGLSPTGES